MNDIMLKIDNVSKQYKLGQIGGTTLRDELQRRHAKRRGLEDPTKRIGAKDYNKGETFMALNGISFEVRKGERVGIIGHNGAGKSTLLKLISRVTAPTGGTIGLNGRVASMLEVGTGFHGELTGRENIYMNGAILGMTKKEIDAKIEDIIEFSECRQFIDTPVKRYSSGMYVKLAFSVAAHLDSEIMIMDEVLAVGDMAFQKKCLDKMNDVSKTQGRTILYVSHNMNTIRQLCQRVIVLDHGKVVFDGDVEEGIGMYSGINASSQLIHKYSDKDRRSGETKKVELTQLQLLDVSQAVYSNGEPIRIRVFVKFNETIAKVKLRFELYSYGNVVGTMFQDKAFGGFKGENEIIEIQIPTVNFANTRYYAIAVLYEEDAGRQVRVDRIENALSFEIIPNNNETFSWNLTCWGNVKFDNMITDNIASSEHQKNGNSNMRCEVCRNSQLKVN